ncbi:histidinol-phosphatase [soil metagenome]
MDLAALRDFALHLADAADAIALDRFGGPVLAVTKPDGSPVTAADKAIEATLRARIAAAHPDHAILGEEEGGHPLDPAVPTWVIDPIDATANFMRGVPVFATLVALVHGGQPIVGVASAPAMGERWDAAEGLGARRNDVQVGVSAIASLADAHVLHGGLRWYRDDPAAWELLGALADDSWRTRGFGDYWMHLLVAGGMADVALDRDLKPWDIAAPACIVTEAGGRATDWEGGPALGTGDLLSTNGVLHDELTERLLPHAGRPQR